jgi:hypothetical protein
MAPCCAENIFHAIINIIALTVKKNEKSVVHGTWTAAFHWAKT